MDIKLTNKGQPVACPECKCTSWKRLAYNEFQCKSCRYSFIIKIDKNHKAPGEEK